MNVVLIVTALLGALCACTQGAEIRLGNGQRVLKIGKGAPKSGAVQHTLVRPHHFHPPNFPVPAPAPVPVPAPNPQPIPYFPRPIPIPVPVPGPNPTPDTDLRCEDGSLPVDCSGVSPAVCNVGCAAYPHASCDLDRCDACRPKFFVENIAVCCDKCSSGYSPVSSPFGDPCLRSACGADEYCKPIYCTLPERRFPTFECIPNCRDSSGNLIGDGRREECFSDPCERVTCPSNFYCSADLCSCSATCLPGTAPVPSPVPVPVPGYSGHIPLPIPIPAPEPGYSGHVPTPAPVPVPEPGYSGVHVPAPVPAPVPVPVPEPGYSGVPVPVPQPVVPQPVAPSPYVYAQGKK